MARLAGRYALVAQFGERSHDPGESAGSNPVGAFNLLLAKPSHDSGSGGNLVDLTGPAICWAAPIRESRTDSKTDRATKYEARR